MLGPHASKVRSACNGGVAGGGGGGGGGGVNLRTFAYMSVFSSLLVIIW